MPTGATLRALAHTIVGGRSAAGALFPGRRNFTRDGPSRTLLARGGDGKVDHSFIHGMPRGLMSQQNGRDPRLSAMQAAFGDSYQNEAPFREDRELMADLLLELEPVLGALLELDLSSAEVGVEHEAAALVTLLSRRAGLLGATPTAASALLRGVFAALRAADLKLGDRVQRDLTSLVFEGYAAGSEERSVQALQRSMARSHDLLELAPRVFTLRFLPDVDAPSLTPVLEEIERELLRRDALVLVNELSALRQVDEEQARAIMGLVETARSLGVRVLFVGASAAFWTQLAALKLDAGEFVRHDGFAPALADALRIAGYEIKPRRRWVRPFFRKALLRERRAR